MGSSSMICQEPSVLVSDVHEDWIGIKNTADDFGTKFLLPSEGIADKGAVKVADSNFKDETNSSPQGTLKTPFKLSGLTINGTKETLQRFWFGHNQTEGKDCKSTECYETKEPPIPANSKFNATKEALLQRIGFGQNFNEGKGFKTEYSEKKESPPTDDAGGGSKMAVNWSQTKEAIQRLSVTLTTTAAARAEPVRRSWNQFVEDIKEKQKNRNRNIDSQFTDSQRQESLTDVLLPPRKGYSIPFSVPSGSTISWNFRVKATGGAQEEELFQSFPFEAGVTYQGSWTAPEHENGNTQKDVYRIVLLWDNSYSYIRSKTIAYSVEIRTKKELMQLPFSRTTGGSENETENITTSTVMPLVAHDEQHNSPFFASPVSNEIVIA